jgi:hypothetical protein
MDSKEQEKFKALLLMKKMTGELPEGKKREFRTLLRKYRRDVVRETRGQQ